jgi:predicted SAM-dependent methyltransferase
LAAKYSVTRLIKYAIRSIAKIPLGNKYYCCICNTKVGRFLPYRRGSRSRPFMMSLLDVIGSDVDKFSCPKCGSHDRERHLKLYMKKNQLLDKFAAAKVLHFAPERHLQTLIQLEGPAEYVKADLFPASSDVMKVNMQDMPFQNEYFDFVIANHVLEHVHDYSKALSEIHRVLGPGGYAILQTPYSAKLHDTFSDPGVDNDELRLQLYGQEDHVRLYGNNIFDLFSSFGFENEVVTHQDALAEYKSDKYGVNNKEPFFLFKRP